MRVNLRGRVALVTGAGGGIGRAIAQRLAAEGAAVVVDDIDARAGAETLASIEAAGGKGALVVADVGVEAQVRAMIAFAEERYGGLDVLVNNAGIAPEPNFPKGDPAHWGRTLDVNLHGTMWGIQFAIEVMCRRAGGAIVNISSMAGVMYQPYDAPEYAASKAAIVHLTTALGGLKGTLGIRVNCICPGWVETEKVHEFLARATPEELRRLSVPPPRVLIQPQQVADLVVMFIGEDSLAGRVAVWPDGQPWHLVPDDRRYRY